MFVLLFISLNGRKVLPSKHDATSFLKIIAGWRNSGEVHKTCCNKENKSLPCHHLSLLSVTKKNEQVTAASQSLSLLLCRQDLQVGGCRGCGTEWPVQGAAQAAPGAASEGSGRAVSSPCSERPPRNAVRKAAPAPGLPHPWPREPTLAAYRNGSRGSAPTRLS